MTRSAEFKAMIILKAFFHWGTRSLVGYLLLSFIFLTIPLLLLGFITNIRAGYPMADWKMIVLLSIVAAIPPPLFIWYYIRPFIRRRNDN